MATHDPQDGGALRKVCGACFASYDALTWERLESCGAIAGDEVKAVITGWPETAVIDLRRCARCKATMARRRPA